MSVKDIQARIRLIKRLAKIRKRAPTPVKQTITKTIKTVARTTPSPSAPPSKPKTKSQTRSVPSTPLEKVLSSTGASPDVISQRTSPPKPQKTYKTGVGPTYTPKTTSQLLKETDIAIMSRTSPSLPPTLIGIKRGGSEIRDYEKTTGKQYKPPEYRAIESQIRNLSEPKTTYNLARLGELMQRKNIIESKYNLPRPIDTGIPQNIQQRALVTYGMEQSGVTPEYIASVQSTYNTSIDTLKNSIDSVKSSSENSTWKVGDKTYTRDEAVSYLTSALTDLEDNPPSITFKDVKEPGYVYGGKTFNLLSPNVYQEIQDYQTDATKFIGEVKLRQAISIPSDVKALDEYAPGTSQQYKTIVYNYALGSQSPIEEQKMISSLQQLNTTAFNKMTDEEIKDWYRNDYTGWIDAQGNPVSWSDYVKQGYTIGAVDRKEGGVSLVPPSDAFVGRKVYETLVKKYQTGGRTKQEAESLVRKRLGLVAVMESPFGYSAVLDSLAHGGKKFHIEKYLEGVSSGKFKNPDDYLKWWDKFYQEEAKRLTPRGMAEVSAGIGEFYSPFAMSDEEIRKTVSMNPKKQDAVMNRVWYNLALSDQGYQSALQEGIGAFGGKVLKSGAMVEGVYLPLVTAGISTVAGTGIGASAKLGSNLIAKGAKITGKTLKYAPGLIGAGVLAPVVVSSGQELYQAYKPPEKYAYREVQTPTGEVDIATGKKTMVVREQTPSGVTGLAKAAFPMALQWSAAGVGGKYGAKTGSRWVERGGPQKIAQKFRFTRSKLNVPFQKAYDTFPYLKSLRQRFSLRRPGMVDLTYKGKPFYETDVMTGQKIQAREPKTNIIDIQHRGKKVDVKTVSPKEEYLNVWERGGPESKEGRTYIKEYGGKGKYKRGWAYLSETGTTDKTYIKRPINFYDPRARGILGRTQSFIESKLPRYKSKLRTMTVEEYQPGATKRTKSRIVGFEKQRPVFPETKPQPDYSKTPGWEGIPKSRYQPSLKSGAIDDMIARRYSDLAYYDEYGVKNYNLAPQKKLPYTTSPKLRGREWVFRTRRKFPIRKGYPGKPQPESELLKTFPTSDTGGKSTIIVSKQKPTAIGMQKIYKQTGTYTQKMYGSGLQPSSIRRVNLELTGVQVHVDKPGKYTINELLSGALEGEMPAKDRAIINKIIKGKKTLDIGIGGETNAVKTVNVKSFLNKKIPLKEGDVFDISFGTRKTPGAIDDYFVTLGYASDVPSSIKLRGIKIGPHVIKPSTLTTTIAKGKTQVGKIGDVPILKRTESQFAKLQRLGARTYETDVNVYKLAKKPLSLPEEALLKQKVPEMESSIWKKQLPPRTGRGKSIVNYWDATDYTKMSPRVEKGVAISRGYGRTSQGTIGRIRERTDIKDFSELAKPVEGEVGFGYIPRKQIGDIKITAGKAYTSTKQTYPLKSFTRSPVVTQPTTKLPATKTTVSKTQAKAAIMEQIVVPKDQPKTFVSSDILPDGQIIKQPSGVSMGTKVFSLTQPISRSVIQPLTRTISNIISVNVTRTIERSLIRQEPRTINKEYIKSIERNITENVNKEITKTINREITKYEQKQVQKQIQKQLQKQITKVIPRTFSVAGGFPPPAEPIEPVVRTRITLTGGKKPISSMLYPPFMFPEERDKKRKPKGIQIYAPGYKERFYQVPSAWKAAQIGPKWRKTPISKQPNFFSLTGEK